MKTRYVKWPAMQESPRKLLTYQKCPKYSPSTTLFDWNIDFPNMYHV